MANSLKSTGQLRTFLSNMLVGLKDGSVKVDEARAMVKLAEKINESFYSELKIAQVNIQLNRKVEELGGVSIGN